MDVQAQVHDETSSETNDNLLVHILLDQHLARDHGKRSTESLALNNSQ